MKDEIKFGKGRREGAGSVGCSLMVGKVVSPYVEGVLDSQPIFKRRRKWTHSQVCGLPIIPIRGIAWDTTSGVKRPLDALASGLSCLRTGIPGISDAELRGIGFGLGDTGGRETWDDVRVRGGLGNKLSAGGGAPDSELVLNSESSR